MSTILFGSEIPVSDPTSPKLKRLRELLVEAEHEMQVITSRIEALEDDLEWWEGDVARLDAEIGTLEENDGFDDDYPPFVLPPYGATLVPQHVGFFDSVLGGQA